MHRLPNQLQIVAEIQHFQFFGSSISAQIRSEKYDFCSKIWWPDFENVDFGRKSSKFEQNYGFCLATLKQWFSATIGSWAWKFKPDSDLGQYFLVSYFSFSYYSNKFSYFSNPQTRNSGEITDFASNPWKIIKFWRYPGFSSGYFWFGLLNCLSEGANLNHCNGLCRGVYVFWSFEYAEPSLKTR